MTFTSDEMVSALERIGYEVRQEEEEREFQYNGSQAAEVKTYLVYNVYLSGVPMSKEFWMEGMGGYKRVQWIFEHELNKRVLSLFR